MTVSTDRGDGLGRGSRPEIALCEADKSMRVVRLTTEEEGVALLAGAWLGGEPGVLLMQSSGVGNCINMLSLPLGANMPLLMLVTMRGDHGEFNSSQVPMGNNTQRVLEAIDVIVKRADHDDEVAAAVSGGLRLTFNTFRPSAVLMGLGSLATVAVQAPKNLAVVVLDNERYGETGQQLTHTGLGTDLAGIAAASGYASAVMVKGGAELGNLAAAMWKGRGPMLAQIKVDPEKLPIVLPPREVSYLKNRMRISILGEACLQQ